MIGAAIVAVVLFFAVFGTVLAPFPGHVAGAVDTANQFQAPSAAHLFGTNELGQDVLSLVMAGTTVSVLAGFGVVLIGSVIGTLVGAVASFVGGWTDEGLMRLTDLTLTIPSLILAMAIAAALGPGFTNMVIAISLSWWPGYARLVRGEVLAAREEVYVTAAPSAPAPRASCSGTSCPMSSRRSSSRCRSTWALPSSPWPALASSASACGRPPGMGDTPVALSRQHARLLVDGDGPRPGDVPCRLRLQPPGRRAARHSRPEGEALDMTGPLLSIRDLHSTMTSFDGGGLCAERHRPDGAARRDLGPCR